MPVPPIAGAQGEGTNPRMALSPVASPAAGVASDVMDVAPDVGPAQAAPARIPVWFRPPGAPGRLVRVAHHAPTPPLPGEVRTAQWAATLAEAIPLAQEALQRAYTAGAGGAARVISGGRDAVEDGVFDLESITEYPAELSAGGHLLDRTEEASEAHYLDTGASVEAARYLAHFVRPIPFPPGRSGADNAAWLVREYHIVHLQNDGDGDRVLIPKRPDQGGPLYGGTFS